MTYYKQNQIGINCTTYVTCTLDMETSNVYNIHKLFLPESMAMCDATFNKQIKQNKKEICIGSKTEHLHV